MAIREADNDKWSMKRFLKRFDGIKVIKKKIAIPLVRFFLCIRFKDVPRIPEGMFPKVPFKNMIRIMAQQVNQAFPSQKPRGFFSDSWDVGKMLQGFKRMVLGELLGPLVP